MPGEAPTSRQYLCIDLKSFYASVECVDRGLDPMTTNLVVADLSRTEKTICLAVSPSMKALGVPGRCRVFEIPKGIKYIAAVPRMARYIERSADVYGVYLKYIAKEDIHVYSIDEAFMDVTGYLSLYGCTARELGERIRRDVYETTGIPASCGLGTNLYLAKIALDITAKHSPDFFGELDEESYRATLWNHRPLTDFWRIGPGISRRLLTLGIQTMGQLAMAPQEPLYKEFGIDAELLIDHAWGIEPVTIADIKAYRSKNHSFSAGQVLASDYEFDDALLVAKEMAEALSYRLVREGLETTGVSLWVGYAVTDVERELVRASIEQRRRLLPGASGSRHFSSPTSSTRQIRDAVEEIFEEKVDRTREVRRLGVGAVDVRPRGAAGTQLELLIDEPELDEEHARTQALNEIRSKFGSNAILKGMDFLPNATTRERNSTIGGHRSGK